MRRVLVDRARDKGRHKRGVAAIDDPVARAALLSERCGEDAALVARVNALLLANDRTATFESAAEVSETANFPGKYEHIGVILAGKYKLRERIGEGGMGECPGRRR